MFTIHKKLIYTSHINMMYITAIFKKMGHIKKAI